MTEDRFAQEQIIRKILNFPTQYDFKIFGIKDDFDFESIIIKIENALKKEISRDNIKIRDSRKRKYISYTLTVQLDRFEDMEEVYNILKNDKTVIMYL